MKFFWVKCLDFLRGPKPFEVYTDGSFKKGVGGWAFVVLRNQKIILEKSGKVTKTGSNQMELLAAIEALQSLPLASKVKVFSDSRVLVDSLNRFVPKWKALGWFKKNGKAIPNVELFKQLDEHSQRHQVEWVWVRAHSGNLYNERCDQLSAQARLD